MTPAVCPAGKFSAAGDATCRTCASGYESPAGAAQCCLPLNNCEQSANATLTTRYNPATLACDNAVNVPAASNLQCRAANAAQCLQPLTCLGTQAVCFLATASQPEVASTVTFTGVSFSSPSAFTVEASTAYWSRTSFLTLALTGTITAPTYCPAPAAFSVGTLVQPSGVCPAATTGTSGPPGVLWSPDGARPGSPFNLTGLSLTSGTIYCVYLRVTGKAAR